MGWSWRGKAAIRVRVSTVWSQPRARPEPVKVWCSSEDGVTHWRSSRAGWRRTKSPNPGIVKATPPRPLGRDEAAFDQLVAWTAQGVGAPADAVRDLLAGRASASASGDTLKEAPVLRCGACPACPVQVLHPVIHRGSCTAHVASGNGAALLRAAAATAASSLLTSSSAAGARSASAAAKSERLEARATEDEVTVIARAAELLNATVSSFVVGAAVEKDEAIVARAERTLMPAAQFDAMIDALDDTTVVPEVVELASRPRRVARRRRQQSPSSSQGC
ncbi:DUF1778 domain-containing protein [Nocardioides immobilis]|uniref:DUF1778 domain-containing protein n=1 Tax=Nocardioides immobilis TaxID=2049295 RepID=A0A417XZS7_9ACTN|nr:DUF1778 domain-containing protein [Nocardioides immobilis]